MKGESGNEGGAKTDQKTKGQKGRGPRWGQSPKQGELRVARAAVKRYAPQAGEGRENLQAGSQMETRLCSGRGTKVNGILRCRDLCCPMKWDIIAAWGTIRIVLLPAK